MATYPDYPILCTGRPDATLRAVPWAFVAPHERQAQRNHYQTLDRLAQRGGLSPCELVAVLEDRPWRAMPLDAAEDRVRELLAAWKTECTQQGTPK